MRTLSYLNDPPSNNRLLILVVADGVVAEIALQLHVVTDGPQHVQGTASLGQSHET